MFHASKKKPQKLENGNKFMSRNLRFDATQHQKKHPSMKIYRVFVYYLQPSFVYPIFAFSRNIKV